MRTITDPDFGTHTEECHSHGWYVLDWDSECMRPSQWPHTDSTDASVIAAELLQDRTQDASQ